MNRNRPDEEYAREAFDAYLRAKAVEGMQWRDGDEPPDYYLMIKGIRYAVEITSLFEDVRTSAGVVSKENVNRSMDRFIGEIETQALQNRILTGTYMVIFNLYSIDFYVKRLLLKKEFLEAIAATQSLSEDSKIDIVIEGRKYFTLLKLNHEGASLKLGAYPSSGARISQEAEVEASSLLSKAISTKAAKLAQLKMSKILLVLERYEYVYPLEYKRFFSDKEQVTDFHTIFIVGIYKDSQHCMLHTSCQAWE